MKYRFYEFFLWMRYIAYIRIRVQAWTRLLLLHMLPLVMNWSIAYRLVEHFHSTALYYTVKNTLIHTLSLCLCAYVGRSQAWLVRLVTGMHSSKYRVSIEALFSYTVDFFRLLIFIVTTLQQMFWLMPGKICVTIASEYKTPHLQRVSNRLNIGFQWAHRLIGNTNQLTWYCEIHEHKGILYVRELDVYTVVFP